MHHSKVRVRITGDSAHESLDHHFQETLDTATQLPLTALCRLLPSASMVGRGAPGKGEARRKGGPEGESCNAHRVEEQLIPVLARDGDEPVVQQRAVLDLDLGVVHHLAAAG